MAKSIDPYACLKKQKQKWGISGDKHVCVLAFTKERKHSKKERKFLCTKKIILIIQGGNMH